MIRLFTTALYYAQARHSAACMVVIGLPSTLSGFDRVHYYAHAQVHGAHWAQVAVGLSFQLMQFDAANDEPTRDQAA